MKSALVLILASVIFLSATKTSLAVYDPLSVPNNKFGIHISSENDLDNASALVNSSSGDWGYVTLVITENERDHARWQRVLDHMRRLHLIPIVRIATKPSGDIWEKPKGEEIETWVSFLNSLNWVVKNRYVVIANEPNHAKEWGGEINPGEYATYLKSFSQKLKEVSDDFFILPAGLDASAPNARETMDETRFVQRMLEKEPDVFNYIDGWTSHSYPNPGFKGKATDSGKGSIRTFDWELSYLKTFGVSKNLPVFITETGWSNKNLTEEEIGERLVSSFQNVWSDERVVAVTPFIINYTQSPFEEFSWQKRDGSFYSFYDKVRDLPKIKGIPTQEVRGKILAAFVNPFLLTDSSFNGIVLAQNLGQSIWVYPEVTLDSEAEDVVSVSSEVPKIETQSYEDLEPQKLKLIYFKGKTPQTEGKNEIPLLLKFKDKLVSESYSLEVLVVRPAELKKLGFFDKIRVYLDHFFGKKW